MPYSFHELVHQHVLYEIVEGHITLDEVGAAADYIFQWLDSLDHNNGVFLVNLEYISTFPADVLKIYKSASPFLSHPNLKTMAIYGKGDAIVLKFIINTIVPMSGLSATQATKLVSNYAEAREVIISQHPELEEQLPASIEELPEKP